MNLDYSVKDLCGGVWLFDFCRVYCVLDCSFQFFETISFG
jgi:hypothetical protein